MNELGRSAVRHYKRFFRVSSHLSFSTLDFATPTNSNVMMKDAYQSELIDGKLHISLSTAIEPDKDLIVTQPNDSIPETVLQYERQMRKRRAADKAGSALSKEDHLRVIYEDPHLVVTDKLSGTLCVPGVNHNQSLLTLVHQEYAPHVVKPDSMIVHRLDMDTSGLVVFGRTPEAVAGLHKAFRERNVEKCYEALVCGHVSPSKGCIDLPLQRDHERPPFMRVSTASSEQAAAQAVHDLQHNGWKKLVRKRPKPSQTEFKVLSREYLKGTQLPVTRLSLTPVTGRYAMESCAGMHNAHLSHVSCWIQNTPVASSLCCLGTRNSGRSCLWHLRGGVGQRWLFRTGHGSGGYGPSLPILTKGDQPSCQGRTNVLARETTKSATPNHRRSHELGSTYTILRCEEN